MVNISNINPHREKQFTGLIKFHKWAIFSSSSVLVGSFSYWHVASVMSAHEDESVGFEYALTWMPLVMIILAASFILSIIATVKVRKAAKVVTILLTVVAAVVFMLAWFAYWVAQPN